MGGGNQCRPHANALQVTDIPPTPEKCFMNNQTAIDRSNPNREHWGRENSRKSYLPPPLPSPLHTKEHRIQMMWESQSWYPFPYYKTLLFGDHKVMQHGAISLSLVPHAEHTQRSPGDGNFGERIPSAQREHFAQTAAPTTPMAAFSIRHPTLGQLHLEIPTWSPIPAR